VFDAGSNPNYTRSLGNAIEPTEHTGILATYKVNDMISLSAGIANTLMAGINRRAWNNDYYQGYQNRDWNKTFMGSVTITAPSSWGWAAGSSFYAGIVYGFNGQAGDNNGFYANGNQVNYYAGATLNTPWKQLTVGAAFDYAHNFDGGSEYADPGTSTWKHEHIDVLVAGLYATYKATDKLSFNARGEYVYSNYNSQGIDYRVHYSDCHEGDGFELTGTVEYDLWANVISRLEVRWDHINQDWIGGGTDGYYELDNRDSVGFYANIIYKF